MARTPKVVEDRREQILDAALRVFAQKGFSRATNKDIAHEAGITPGLIYHYFESKDALLKAIVEGRTPLALVRALPPDVFALPPAQFLPLLFQQVLAFVESERFVQLLRIMLPEMIHNPNISPFAFAAFGEVVDVLEKYLTQKIATGELHQANARLVAQTWLSCTMGFVLRRQVMRDPSVLSYTHVEIANAVSEIVLKGLLPE